MSRSPPAGTGASPRPSPVGPCWVPGGSGPGQAPLSCRRGGRNAGAGLGAPPEGRRADRARRAEALERCTANGPFLLSSPGLGGFLTPTPRGGGGCSACSGLPKARSKRSWSRAFPSWRQIFTSTQPHDKEETWHIINVLHSHEIPFTKKQQVMNHVFENYCLKMANDQKSTEKAVSEVDPEAPGTPQDAVSGVAGAEQTQTDSRATERENCNGALSFAASGQEPDFAIREADFPLAPSVPASQPIEPAADHEVLRDSLPTESAAVPQISALQKTEVTQTAGSAPKESRSHVRLKIPQPETAPEDETVAEKSTGGGAAQKKKKKKQKPSVSKKIEQTEISRKAKEEANGCQNKDTSHQDEMSQQSDDQLWKEVNWCVEQLELGLKTQKPTPKQAEEALRAIKTLRSDKAPLVKKRQLMRTMFGDYRKKMEEDWCKELKLMEAALKSATIVEVKRDIRNKNSQFIRKCSGAYRKSQASAESPSESPRTLNTGPFKFLNHQEEFRFNFF
ncbi:UPF0488 protein C8orf33 homolog isoform X2 [Patagioenas fasciata]|uniref:UPF0488 protein C8orf33 homolog isoform X2 n=1 Tax=Patagioenas fasciata TaxID=372321 RepID=UPI003A9993B2